MILIGPETTRVFEFLQKRESFPITYKQVEKEASLGAGQRKILVFVIALFEFFGRQHRVLIEARLDSKLREELDQVDRAFYEILQSPQEHYLSSTHPETAKLIGKYRSHGLSDGEFFAEIRRKALKALPFSQRRIFYYSGGPAQVEETEKVRRAAFGLLKSFLINQKMPPTASGEAALTHLVFCAGAFTSPERIFHYSDMLDQWAALSPVNHQVKEDLLHRLSLSKWVKGEGNGSPPAEVKSERSFFSFLVHSTIDALERALGIGFLPSFRKYLERLFDEEEVRLDVHYAALHLEGFKKNREIASFKRSSKPFLLSLQLFFSVVETYSVFPLKQPALLAMIVHRYQREGWDLPKQWEKKLVKQELNIFPIAWMMLEGLFQIMKRREKIANEEEFFNQPSCWPVLFGLVRDGQRGYYPILFGELLKNPEINVTMEQIYRFQQANSREEVEPSAFGAFAHNYALLLEMVRRAGFNLERAERLFLDPPICLTTDQEVFSELETKTAQFLDMMFARKFQFTDPIVAFFRAYLFSPVPQLFDLFSDTDALGIQELTAGNIRDYVSYPLPRFTAPVISPERKREAQEVALNLQKAYQFEDPHLFSLYLEILSLMDQGISLEEVSQEVSRFVLELKIFCPVLKSQDVFFLFRYRPADLLPSLEELQRLREIYLRDIDRERFILPQEFVWKVLSTIFSLTDRLSEACNVEKTKGKFVASFRETLIFAFFPPSQLLSDCFRIDRLTPDGGVRWSSSHLTTHLGQLKRVKEGAVGIYLHWHVIQGLPHLFISFSNLEKIVARSTFIPLSIPIGAISEHEKSLFPYLIHLTQYVLTEEAARDPQKETQSDYVSCFTALKHELDALNDGKLSAGMIEEVWKFIKKVKVAYRNSYLDLICGDLSAPLLSSPKVAQRGLIFPSGKGGGTLLPPSNAIMEPHPEFYTSDSSEEKILPLMALFTHPQKAPVILSFPLVVTSDRKQREEYPMSALIQTTSDLVEQPIVEKHWDGRALPLKELQGRYVTLSIGHSSGKIDVPLYYPPGVLSDSKLFFRYFDFHILILKARCYHEI